MSQTTISAGGQAVGNPGDPADAGPKDVVSGFNEESAQMPFGYGVRDGGTVDFYKLATGFSGVYPVTGVVLRRANYQPQITLANGQTVGDLGNTGLVQYAPLNVGRKGRFLVPVEAAVTNGQGAWCRGVATGANLRGSWRGATRNPDLVGAGVIVGPGCSYFVDCSKQAVFRSASFTAADGTTLVAVLEVDFTSGPY